MSIDFSDADYGEGDPFAPGPPLEPVDDFASRFLTDLEREVQRIRVRDAARDKVDREKAGHITLPPLTSLTDFLKIPDEDVTHRVAGLWPTGGRVVLAAQNKAGKTTTVGNLTRSLVDGDAFLDAFKVETVGRLVLLDNELDDRMLRRWLRDQGIHTDDAVDLVALRGRLSTFNIIDPATRSRWAAHIGPGDVLVFDCLRPALDALGLSEDKDAGRFLEALDELAREAGIREIFLVHHMGHSSERARGDSRILDWPDAVWKLVRDGEDEDQVRRVYFSAYGRDVDQGESLLAFDAETRHLRIAGGTRKDTRSDHLVEAVVTFVTEHPGLSKNKIEKGLEGRATDIRDALDKAVERGLIHREKSGTAYLHNPTSSTSSHLVPDERTNPPRDLVPSSIGRGTRTRGPEEEDTSSTGTRDEPTHCTTCGRRLTSIDDGHHVCIQCRRIANHTIERN